jgi:UDP-N-acetylglucosamine 2-epimerase (non-hydrolysing)
MNDVFFRELGIPEPDVHLEVGSGSHGSQTARILERYEAHLMKHTPAATVVFGDVNSTIACALAAVKLGVPVVHVEAGLRSFDRTMPEEINRLLTDAVSDLLLVSEPSGFENLRREGVPENKIRLVGNVMIDTLLGQLETAKSRMVAKTFGLEPKKYGFVTIHRPSNVDDAGTLKCLLNLLHELAEDIPLVFPVHPRTSASAKRLGLESLLHPNQPFDSLRPEGSDLPFDKLKAPSKAEGLRVDTEQHFSPHPEGWGPGRSKYQNRLFCIPPQPYLESISLLADATVVLTDSGGLQEETSVLGIPCLTLRENTERPITLELGTSRLVGNNPEKIRAAFQDVLSGTWPPGQPIPLWDGKAANRVVKELVDWLNRR